MKIKSHPLNSKKINLTEKIIDKFNSKYKPDPETGCWNWVGNINKNGYGRLSIQRTPFLAHRVSFKIHKSEDISGYFSKLFLHSAIVHTSNTTNF